MLIAFEGPDGAGKTTLFDAAKLVLPGIFVPKRVFAPELTNIIEVMDAYCIPLWRALRDTKTTIFVDRCPWISSPVYSSMYARPNAQLFCEEFVSDLLVVYVRVPAYELIARKARTENEVLTEATANRLLTLYDRHVSNFKHIVLDGRNSVEYNVGVLKRELAL